MISDQLLKDLYVKVRMAKHVLYFCIAVFDITLLFMGLNIWVSFTIQDLGRYFYKLFLLLCNEIFKLLNYVLLMLFRVLLNLILWISWLRNYFVWWVFRLYFCLLSCFYIIHWVSFTELCRGAHWKVCFFRFHWLSEFNMTLSELEKKNPK